MGNCFKSSYSYRNFDDSLIRSLNEPSLETEINKLHTRVSQLETKMEILESNTQDNLKSISDDLHFVNNTVLEHHNVLGSQESQNSNLNSNLKSNLNPTPLRGNDISLSDITHSDSHRDITHSDSDSHSDIQESIYKSVTFRLDEEETY